MSPMPASYLWFIPLLPFAGFLINGTLGRKLPRAAGQRRGAAVYGAAGGDRRMAVGDDARGWRARFDLRSPACPWIAITGFTVNFAFTVDHLTLIMLGVVTGVGFLIHIYSVGYMARRRRLLALLRLPEPVHVLHVGAGAGRELPAAVCRLGRRGPGELPADRLLLPKTSAANAGKKAFVVNRIGDFGFLLAMFLLIAHFGSLNFTPGLRDDRPASGVAGRAFSYRDRAAAGAGRGGQVGADSAVRVAAGRDGGPDAGFSADPRGDHGDGGNLHGRAVPYAVRPLARLRWPLWPASARRPRSSLRRSAWCSTTSSGCWPTRPFRNLGTCFWPAALAPMQPASSTY